MGTIKVTRRQLERGVAVPLDERTRIVVGPDAVVATLLGRVFQAQKTFPLPRAKDALEQLFGFVRSWQEAKHAIVVGHVSQGQESSEAEKLTAARAEVIAEWMQGEVAKWVERFSDSDAALSWGADEEHAMIRALPEFGEAEVAVGAPSPNAAPGKRKDPLVQLYQRARGLEPDGIAGPITRKQLVSDYFALTRRALAPTPAPAGDDASSPAPKFEFDVATHGAGANFTLAATQKAVRDADAKNESAAESKSAATPSAATPSAATPRVGPQGAPPEGTESDLGTDDERVDVLLFFADGAVEPALGDAAGPEFLELMTLTSSRESFRAGRPAEDAIRIALELFDHTGTQRHARQAFEITGPERFSGQTDADGRIRLMDVLAGDYTLALTLTAFSGADEIKDVFKAPVLALAPAAAPQRHFLGAVPRSKFVRLRGMLFATNKAFLQPAAVRSLKNVRTLYLQNNPSELLVVGHTDTVGGADINDPLSLERAESTLAYLKDDAAKWLEFYGTKLPKDRRWGPLEDEQMIRALPGFDPAAAGDDLVGFFRRTRNISETGPMGTATRSALIKEYMALDGAEVDASDLRIGTTIHGCGENFPVDDSGEQLDEAPSDDSEDALDRRVELFFFDSEFGIVPKPRGKNSKKGSTEYPRWRAGAILVDDIVVEPEPLARLTTKAGVPLVDVPNKLVVANIDVNARALPANVGVSPAQTKDFDQPTASADDLDLFPFQVRSSDPSRLAGLQLSLRFVDPSSRPNATPSAMHTRVSFNDSGGTVIPSPAGVSQTRLLPALPSSGVLDLTMEVRTIAGSPFGQVTPLVPERVSADPEEREFEFELVATDASGQQTVLDRAEFSVSPIILMDRTAPVQQLFICDIPENEPSRRELQAAIARAGGVRLTLVPSAVANGDTWLQDQYQHSVCQDMNGNWHQVILHLPRLKQNMINAFGNPNLRAFVDTHFPSKGIGVFDDLWRRELAVKDGTGAVQRITFVDTFPLFMRMGGVFNVVSRINRYGTYTDGAKGTSGTPQWKLFIPKDWVDARQGLADHLLQLQHASLP